MATEFTVTPSIQSSPAGVPGIFTVEAVGGNFNPTGIENETISVMGIADGFTIALGAGATVVGGGSHGLNFKPLTNVSSFTFTDESPVAGTDKLTFDNNFGATNPSPTTFIISPAKFMTASCTTLDAKGNILAGVVIKFTAQAPPTGESGVSYGAGPIVGVSNGSGLLEVELFQNTTYIMQRGVGTPVRFTTSTGDLTLPDSIGNP